MKTIKITVLLLLVLLIKTAYSQDNVGTLAITIDGNRSTFNLLQVSTSTSYEVNGGDSKQGLKIFWNNITSAAGIKSGTTALPDKKSNVTVTYVNFTNSIPSVTISGTLTTTVSVDGSTTTVNGTMNFKALEGGIPKELGGTEHNFTEGDFMIRINNK